MNRLFVFTVPAALCLLSLVGSSARTAAQSSSTRMDTVLAFAPEDADFVACVDVKRLTSFLEDTDYSAATRDAAAYLQNAWADLGFTKEILETFKVEALCNFHIRGSGVHLMVIELGQALRESDMRLLRMLRPYIVYKQRQGRNFLLFSKQKNLAAKTLERANAGKGDELSPMLRELATSLADAPGWTALVTSQHVLERIYKLSGSTESRLPEIAELTAVQSRVIELVENRISIEFGFRYATSERAQSLANGLVARLGALFPDRDKESTIKASTVYLKVFNISFSELQQFLARF